MLVVLCLHDYIPVFSELLQGIHAKDPDQSIITFQCMLEIWTSCAGSNSLLQLLVNIT